MRTLLFLLLTLFTTPSIADVILVIPKIQSPTVKVTSEDGAIVYHNDTAPLFPWKAASVDWEQVPDGNVVVEFNSTSGATSQTTLKRESLVNLVVYFKGEEPVTHFVSHPITMRSNIYLRDPATLNVLYQTISKNNEWILEPYVLDHFNGKYVLIDAAGGDVTHSTLYTQRTEGQHTYALVEKASLYLGSTTISLSTHVAYLSLKDEMNSLLTDEFDELYQSNLRMLVAPGFPYKGPKDYEALYLRDQGVQVSADDFSFRAEELVLKQYDDGNHSLLSALSTLDIEQQINIYAMRFSELYGWFGLDRTTLKSRQYAVDVIGKGKVISSYLTLTEAPHDSDAGTELYRSYRTSIGKREGNGFSLIASPDSGYEFAEWIGCESVRDNWCYPNLEKQIIAIFKPVGATVKATPDNLIVLSEFYATLDSDGHLVLRVFGDSDVAADKIARLSDGVPVETVDGQFYMVSNTPEILSDDTIKVAVLPLPDHQTMSKGYKSQTSGITNETMWKQLTGGDVEYVPNIAIAVPERDVYFITSHNPDDTTLIYAREIVIDPLPSTSLAALANSDDAQSVESADCDPALKISTTIGTVANKNIELQREASFCKNGTESSTTKEVVLMVDGGVRVTRKDISVRVHGEHSTSATAEKGLKLDLAGIVPFSVTPYGSVNSEITRGFSGGYTISIIRVYFLYKGQERFIEERSKVSLANTQASKTADLASEESLSAEVGVKAVAQFPYAMEAEAKAGVGISFITKKTANAHKEIVNPECLNIHTVEGYSVYGLQGSMGPFPVSVEHKKSFPITSPKSNVNKCMRLDVEVTGSDVMLTNPTTNQSFSYKVTNKSGFDVVFNASAVADFRVSDAFTPRTERQKLKPGQSASITIAFDANKFNASGFEKAATSLSIAAQPISGYGNGDHKTSKSFFLRASRQVPTGFFIRQSALAKEISPGIFLFQPHFMDMCSKYSTENQRQLCHDYKSSKHIWTFKALLLRPPITYGDGESFERHEIPWEGKHIDLRGALKMDGAFSFWMIAVPSTQSTWPLNERMTNVWPQKTSRNFYLANKATRRCVNEFGQISLGSTSSVWRDRFDALGLWDGAGLSPVAYGIPQAKWTRKNEESRIYTGPYQYAEKAAYTNQDCEVSGLLYMTK